MRLECWPPLKIPGMVGVIQLSGDSRESIDLPHSAKGKFRWDCPSCLVAFQPLTESRHTGLLPPTAAVPAPQRHLCVFVQAGIREELRHGDLGLFNWPSSSTINTENLTTSACPLLIPFCYSLSIPPFCSPAQGASFSLSVNLFSSLSSLPRPHFTPPPPITHLHYLHLDPSSFSLLPTVHLNCINDSIHINTLNKLKKLTKYPNGIECTSTFPELQLQ